MRDCSHGATLCSKLWKASATVLAGAPADHSRCPTHKTTRALEAHALQVFFHAIRELWRMHDEARRAISRTVRGRHAARTGTPAVIALD